MLVIAEERSNYTVDQEWVELMEQARRFGMSPEDVRHFLATGILSDDRNSN